MNTVFFRMALVLAFVGVFIGGVLASDTVRQPVLLEDQRFNGQFYRRTDTFYGFWEFDGTSRAIFTGYNLTWERNRQFVNVYEFRIYEDGMIRWRIWYEYDHFLFRADAWAPILSGLLSMRWAAACRMAALCG